MELRLARAIDGCTKATLVFDLRIIASTMQALADAARASGIRPLFALKSFPLAAVRSLAATHLDGFDAASLDEVAVALRDHAAPILSIYDPSGLAGVNAPPPRPGRRPRARDCQNRSP